MRLFSVILFLLTITFSDVASNVMNNGDEVYSIVDHTSESETEYEKDFDSKKESKIPTASYLSLKNRNVQLIASASDLNSIKRTSSFLEIHCPPPEFL